LSIISNNKEQRYAKLVSTYYYHLITGTLLNATLKQACLPRGKFRVTDVTLYHGYSVDFY